MKKIISGLVVLSLLVIGVFIYTALQDNAVKIKLPPRVPTVKTASTGNTEVSLTWNEVKDIKDYTIIRVDGDKEIPIATTTSISYRVSGLYPGKTYGFEVAANTETGSALKSNEVWETTAGNPTEPTNLRPTATGNHSITLAWDAGLAAEKYEVYRLSGKSSTLVKTVTTTNASIGTLESDTSYDFYVLSVNNKGKSDLIKPVNVKTANAPENLKFESNKGLIKISWSPSKNPQKYEVLRSSSDKGFASIGYTSTTSYTDKKVTPGKEYLYKVRAYVNNEPTDFSNALLVAMQRTE